jgi:hypothetical protein
VLKGRLDDGTHTNRKAAACQLDDLPQRRADERLEDLARVLMTVTAMLCSAELRSRLCEAETVKRAKRALQAGASARTGLRTVCQPATVAEVCEHIAVLIQSIPQGNRPTATAPP